MEATLEFDLMSDPRIGETVAEESTQGLDEILDVILNFILAEGHTFS